MNQHHNSHWILRTIDALIFRWMFIGLLGLYLVPVVFQSFYLFASPSVWFTIGDIEVLEHDGKQVLRVPRTVKEPVLLEIVWEVHDVSNGRTLCSRQLSTTYERTDQNAIAELALLLRTCEMSYLMGKKIEVQGHFIHTLNYGIKKEQIVVSPAFYLK